MTEKTDKVAKKEPEVIDIKKLDLVALKALAYDVFAQQAHLQRQIDAISAEIASRDA